MQASGPNAEWSRLHCVTFRRRLRGAIRTLTCGLVACAMLVGCAKTESGSPQAVTVPSAADDNTSTLGGGQPTNGNTSSNGDQGNQPPTGTDDGTPSQGAHTDPDTPCYREPWYKIDQKRLEDACVCLFLVGECTMGVFDGPQTYRYKSGQVLHEGDCDDGVQHGA
jgi:hypothetical protein